MPSGPRTRGTGETDPGNLLSILFYSDTPDLLKTPSAGLPMGGGLALDPVNFPVENYPSRPIPFSQMA